MKQKLSESTGLIRLAHPLAFVEYLESHGESTDAKLRRAHMPLYSDDPALWVPLKSAWRFFDEAARAGGRSIGWQVSDAARDRQLTEKLRGTVEHSPTLLEGLRRLIRLIKIESSQLTLMLVERKDYILLCTQYPFKDWPGYHGSQGYQLGVYINLIRHYCGRDWMPATIGIEDSIVCENLQTIYPNVTILAGQPAGYIAIKRQDLIRPPLSAKTLEDKSVTTDEAPPPTYSETVQRVSQAYLRDGYLPAEKMAALLDTSTRTLFRRLAAENNHYQQLIDETRFNVAKHLLQDSDLTLQEIGCEIGINDASNFSRLFRSIGGMTPGAYRKHLRRADTDTNH